ncbi:MAG: hypothetical protein EOL95_12115, partial [Bacteroidia bacterium]|nr:hypothetical protein [Bacteroidia bacterium]
MISSPSEVELRVFENNIEWKLESSIVWNHLIAIPSKLSDLEDDATHRLITDTERIKWDESYSWGDHAGIYSPLNHNHSNLYEPLGLALQLLSQHNSAFEHSLIASALQTETDPIFTASAAFSITALNISGWNEAHSWGDHAGLYSLLSHNHNTDYETIGSAAEALNTHNVAFDHSLISSALQSETDPIFTAWDKSTGISITESQISDFGSYIPTSEKGASLGVATLDAGGKVNLSQLPATLLIYKGVWSATTNTPTLLATDTTKKGWVYNVSVAGTQFGIDWKLGDWAIYNDNGVLEKSDNSDDVVSVNGYQGVVVLNKTDIGLGNVDNTSDLLKPISTATQSALDLKWSWNGNTLGAKKTIGSIDNQDFGIITNNTERLTVLKDGNVGIGTTNPGTRLVVKDDSYQMALEIDNPTLSNKTGLSFARNGVSMYEFSLRPNDNDWSLYRREL